VPGHELAGGEVAGPPETVSAVRRGDQPARSLTSQLVGPAVGRLSIFRAARFLARVFRGPGQAARPGRRCAALVAAGVDGCEAPALRAGLDLSRETLQQVRGWTDDEWDQAASRLTERGWLAPDGTATPDGLAAHRAIEDAADLAAARPWAQLGTAAAEQLISVLGPMAQACAAELPYQPGRRAGPGCQRGSFQVRRPGPSGQEGAQQRGRALQVLGHRVPGRVSLARQDRHHDRGVLARRVVDIAA
jgi:hypothetical protein